MPNRRDFIKALGGALGAGMLTAAGAGKVHSQTAGPPLPSAYTFIKLLSTGDALSSGLTLDLLPGPVMVNATGKAVFYAKDSGGAMGLYELDINNPGEVRKVTRQGDELSNGDIVDSIDSADSNHKGSIAVLAVNQQEHISAVYLEREAGGLEPAAWFNQAIPGSGRRFGAVFSDLDLHGDDDILLVSHFSTEGQGSGQVGLFRLAQGEVNQDASLLLSTPALVHGQKGNVSSLGLIHANHGGDYVLQAFTNNGQPVTSLDHGSQEQDAPNTQGSVLLTGSARKPMSQGYAALAWPQFPKPGGPPASGEIVYGPRISSDGTPAYVVHVGPDRLSMVINNRTVISSGDLAPGGWAVTSMSPPMTGPNGLYYFNLLGYTNQNVFELLVSNGTEAKVILAMLDQVDDRRIINLLWGFHTDQVDDQGRLVFVAEWDDQKTQSLMLAVPA